MERKTAINHIERPLMPELQEKFLKRLYGPDYIRLPAEDYGPAFSVLPYVIMEKSEDIPGFRRPDLGLHIQRLYMGLAGDSDQEIAEVEHITTVSVRDSSNFIASYIATVVRLELDEIIETTNSLKANPEAEAKS